MRAISTGAFLTAVSTANFARKAPALRHRNSISNRPQRHNYYTPRVNAQKNNPGGKKAVVRRESRKKAENR